jgi:hypothetical protein
MQSTHIRKAIAGLAALAVAGVPAAAAAHKGGGENRGKRQNPTVTYRIKGSVQSVDVAAKTLVVTVRQANHHGRALRGRDVAFDVSAARLVVRDYNGDGSRDLGDVSAQDRVLVRARLPKRLAPDAVAQPVKASGVISKHRVASPEPEQEQPAPQS